ncbi:MAG: translation elongation factor Ts [Proteobacteria bacterium]|nr:translation elongation factor Ts [Pseudomonadota bacterium]
MSISAAQVRELRDKTGSGIMDCKKALAETKGDVEAAIDYLREKGLASAKKKAGRVAAEGIVSSYIHGGGSLGVLLEVNCETDFVAKTDDFAALVRDIAMHIAALNPAHVRREEVSEADIEREKKIFKTQALESGKPEKIIDKIIEGKIEKFYKENCLVEQSFVKNPDKSIGDIVTEAIAALGENISIRRFMVFKVGEGIEKEATDLAAEVAAVIKG